MSTFVKSYYPNLLESQRNSRVSSMAFRTPSKSSYSGILDGETEHSNHYPRHANSQRSSSGLIPAMPRQPSSSSFLSSFNRKKSDSESAYTYGLPTNHSQTSFDYQLEKISTRSTIDSNVSTRSQYLIKLTLTKSEIELLRYTWNVMLLSEDIEVDDDSVSSKIPGTFANSLLANASNGHGNHHNNAKYALNSMASSLFCRQFYDNLLSLDPKLIKLFPSLQHQAVAFAGVLSFAVSQLENLSNLEDFLCVLGKKHSRILGISADSFELMGEALIKTFNERFGVRFNRELETLWIKLYCYLADSILQFGIDPVMKFDFERDEANYLNTPATTATNLFYNTEGQERHSSVPMAPSDSDSIANVSLMESGSIVTSATSVIAEPLQNNKRENSVSGIGLGAESAPSKVKESKSKIRSNSAGRKFRKRADCVIV